MRLSLFFLVFLGIKSYAQIDSLNTKGSYWEDQLYFGITYNVLLGQPEGVEASNVSYGFSAGYIKDIPLNKEGTIAFGRLTQIGLKLVILKSLYSLDGEHQMLLLMLFGGFILE